MMNETVPLLYIALKMRGIKKTLESTSAGKIKNKGGKKMATQN